jgi:cephalosporin hydroxylase
MTDLEDSALKKMSPEDAREVIRLANIIYFRSQVYERTEWMGVKTAKCPMDMWVYQELMHTLNTDLLIETGTLDGGSALFFAHVFDALGRGQVVTVDIESRDNLPSHPRITYLTGSSVDEEILAEISALASTATSVMVILDSDHRAPYKLQELQAYASMVTPGNYIVAEDSTFDYFPSWPEYGPGPAAAADRFVRENADFVLDRNPEKHMITFAPRAFIRRR